MAGVMSRAQAGWLFHNKKDVYQKKLRQTVGQHLSGMPWHAKHAFLTKHELNLRKLLRSRAGRDHYGRHGAKEKLAVLLKAQAKLIRQRRKAAKGGA